MGALAFLLVQDAELELTYLVTDFDEPLRVGRVRLREEFSRGHEARRTRERQARGHAVALDPARTVLVE